MDRRGEAKDEIRLGLRHLPRRGGRPLAGPGVLSAAPKERASRGGTPPRSVGWLGSDDILAS